MGGHSWADLPLLSDGMHGSLMALLCGGTDSNVGRQQPLILIRSLFYGNKPLKAPANIQNWLRPNWRWKKKTRKLIATPSLGLFPIVWFLATKWKTNDWNMWEILSEVNLSGRTFGKAKQCMALLFIKWNTDMKDDSNVTQGYDWGRGMWGTWAIYCEECQHVTCDEVQ